MYDERNSFQAGGIRRDDRPPIDTFTMLATGALVAICGVAYYLGRLHVSDLLYIAVLIPSIILHEISHGAMALRFGDATAKYMGRLSLNPIRHIDPLGTLIVPGVLLLLGMPAFGWARPVPVNTSNMTRTQAMLTGVVGPLTNFAIAIAVGLLLRFVLHVHTLSVVENADATLSGAWAWIAAFFLMMGIANIVLGVFNLLPIPPLDGASLVEWILPDALLELWRIINQYGFFILLFLVMATNFSISRFTQPVIHLWQTVIVGA